MSNHATPRPRLSVVIPARNALRWLPGAIASLGSARDLEILVVDDGSDDSTGDYLTSIAATDRRIRPLFTPGLGPAAARNAALAVARAPLIGFLDADDRWRRAKLQRQLELHRLHPEIGFSFTDHRRFAEDGTELTPGFARCPAFGACHAMHLEPFLLDSDAQAAIYAEPLVATSTVMVRTDLLREVGGFNTQLKRVEDWDLWLHLAACAPVGCVPQTLTDRLVRSLDPDAPEALMRRITRARVAAAYAPAVTALDEAAPRLYRRSQIALQADRAALAGRPVRAALLRFSALAGERGRRALRLATLGPLAGQRSP